MLGRLVSFILNREPVLSAEVGLAAGWAALYAVLDAFDVLSLRPEQVAAVGGLMAFLAAWWARGQVTPTAKLPTVEVVHVHDPLDTVEGDSRIGPDVGGIAAGLAVFVIVVVIAFGMCAALTFEDERSMGQQRISQVSEVPPVTWHEDPPPPGVEIAEPVEEELEPEPAVEKRLPETAMATVDDNEPCSGDGGSCQNRSKKGCAESAGPCSDDDNVQVIVCLPQSHCDFSGEEPQPAHRPAARHAPALT